MLSGVNPRRPSEHFPDPSDAGAMPRLPAAVPPAPSLQRRWRWWLIGSMFAVLAFALLHGPIAERLWPQTRVQALYGEARQALAEGRLSAADGSGARELYEAALAMDPDRVAARQGLAQVARAALEQAAVALSEDRFADAHRQLALARELSVPRAEAEDFYRGVERLREDLDRLDARTRALEQAGDPEVER